MALNNVYMWSKHGWKPITAEEASKLHPGGTVDARSGLFMCGFCGQYLTFTHGAMRDRYFKHSKAELNKDCPNRSSSTTNAITFPAGIHGLPIRINIQSKNIFYLEIGFLPLPREIKTTKDQKITIIPCHTSLQPFIYSFARMELDTITYLPVGNLPAEQYRISISDSDNRIRSIWPSIVDGINRDSVLFDAITRKKLPDDADTQIDHSYYLLTKSSISYHLKSICIANKCTQWIDRIAWHVYEIRAIKFTEEAARFFWNYRYRLTETLTSIFPIWPVYVRTPYVIRHKENKIIMHLQGDASAQVFPYTFIKKHPCRDSMVLEVECNDRQQLLSAGRTKVLRYTYLWKDSLKTRVDNPVIKIKDFYGNDIKKGLTFHLPPKNMISISTQYDGHIIVKRNKSIIEKRTLKAGSISEIFDIHYEYCIEVYQGLDCIWSVAYEREPKKLNYSEILILSQLRRCKGKPILIPHTIGSTAIYLNNYPKIKGWLYKKIRVGQMTEQAYQMFINFIATLKDNKSEE